MHDQTVTDGQTEVAAMQRVAVLAAEMDRLVHSELPPQEFFREFLVRLVEAMAAFGGAYWSRDPQGNVQCLSSVKLDELNLFDGRESAARHDRLLVEVARAGQPMCFPPHTGLDEKGEAANATNYLIALAPVVTEGAVAGLVEVVQRPHAAPEALRGLMEFLLQMCMRVNEYLRVHKHRQLVEQWSRFGQFARQAHQGLDLRATAYKLANEGRQFLNCDRLSVAVKRGGKFRVTAVSGQDVVNPRSNLVRKMNDLATRVAAAGDPLWLTEEARELAPQIEQAVQVYLDESHTRTLAVLPLFAVVEPERNAPHAAKRRPRAIGALIVEQFQTAAAGDELRERSELVREHAALALNNALVHRSLFLFPLWKALGKAAWVVQARTLPKTLLVLAAVAAAALALVFVRADFQLEARGTLEPKVRKEVYARLDGIVDRVLLEPRGVETGKNQPTQTKVRQGQELAQLRNLELELQMKTVEGELNTTGKKLAAARASLLATNQQTPEARARHTQLAAEVEQLTTEQASLQIQKSLLDQRQQDLTVLSPIGGEVTTWNVEELLTGRPVQVGQVLMSVADTDGPWVLEVLLPDRRAGHVRAAQKAIQDDLDVTFILATDPAVTYRGKIEKMAMSAQVDEEQGSTVLVTVAIDRRQLDDPRPGATVLAKINCGRRSLGYVWLHDVIEFVQSRILFRL